MDSKSGFHTTIPAPHTPPSSIPFQVREIAPREDARRENTASARGRHEPELKAEETCGAQTMHVVGAGIRHGTQSAARAGPREPSCDRRGARDRRRDARTVGRERSKSLVQTRQRFLTGIFALNSKMISCLFLAWRRCNTLKWQTCTVTSESS